MMLKAETIVELLCLRMEADGAREALGVKREGQYRWESWNEVRDAVASAVAALVQLGVQRGDRVVQVSENRREWIVADLAIQMAGAIHVPIHPTLAGPQIAWQIEHCSPKVVLLSGPGQAGKLSALGEGCPGGPRWVSYDRCEEGVSHRGTEAQSAEQGLLAGRPIELWNDIQAEADVAKGVEAACETRKRAQASDLATILYTSGTTGEPKGVMLTQGNLASNACAAMETFGFTTEQVRLNFLPLSHIFARTCDLYCWLADGARLALAESRETVIADCQAIHPTYLNGVPYFYERVYRALGEHGQQQTPGALKKILGGAIESCCAGGAALPDYLYEYFLSQGVKMLQGYGLSESSPVITMSTPAQHRRGSCGRPIPGIEVRIAEDGEIFTRGPHVMMGYYRNPEATAEVFREVGTAHPTELEVGTAHPTELEVGTAHPTELEVGTAHPTRWLATGDLGRQDDDGFVYITGRKKEILVTSGGKNIAPVFLESLLTEDSLILQAMVVGDARSHLAALIVPNVEAHTDGPLGN